MPEPERGRYKIFLGMAAGVGKTYRMLQEGQAEAEAGRDVVVGARRDPRPRGDGGAGRGPRGRPRRRVDYRGTELEEMDLPGAPRAGARARAWSTSSRTPTPPASSTPSATRTSPTCWPPGIDVFSTVNVQHLESLNDQVAELTGSRVRETVPDRVLARRRRDRARRPDARGADRAPAGRQGLSAGARRRPRSTTSSGSRTCRRCARSRCARWPRRSRRSGASRRSTRARAARTREDRPRRRAAPQAIQERLLALVTPTRVPARRPPRCALGAAARRRARHALRPAPRARAERAASASSSRRCAASPPCSAPTCWSRRATTSRGRRARRARARHDLRPDGRRRRERRGPAPARASRCTTACSSCCRASTCGSSRIALSRDPGEESTAGNEPRATTRSPRFQSSK